MRGPVWHENLNENESPATILDRRNNFELLKQFYIAWKPCGSCAAGDIGFQKLALAWKFQ
jgi:hypothetical protein